MAGWGTRRRALVVALAAALVAPGCWLQAGFDARRSGFNGGETGITSATVAQLAPAWTATVTGAPGEPIVLDGTAYVRGAGAVTALDTATGAVRWTATGLDGGGQPVLAQDHIWVPEAGAGCGLASLDLGTGAVVETRTFGGPPLPNTDTSFSSCGTYDLVAVGKRLMIGWSYFASAIAPRGCFPDPTNAVGAAINAFDTDTTAGAWNTGGVTVSCDPLQFPPPGIRGRLSSDSTTLFAPHAVDGFTGAADSVAGFSVANGAALFSWATPSNVVTPVTPLSDASSELAAVATDGHLYVLDKTTGAVHWSADLGAPASRPVAVTGTTIFVAGGDGRLLAFPVGGCGAATCAPTWTATLSAPATARPSVVGDVLYVGSSDGTLTALAADGCGAATCAALFTTTVPGSVSDSPVADGGVLYVGSSTGTVTAYTLPG
jgi:hypothetical protein